MSDLIPELLQTLGKNIVMLPAEFAGRRFSDWSGWPSGTPKALVRPTSTAEVSAALTICTRHGQSVVVQGGLTGLAGGASAQDGDVVISLERMRQIEEVDPVSATITVQAGVTLQAIQERALNEGFFFPLDLGARGSCTIGGVLATNAGGNRVIKYGMAREQCLGIEAVLPDGRIVGGLHKMLKNNTGYDLRNLLIGSEGTLAIITRAVLRLRARPTTVLTAWCGLPDFHSVTTLLRKAQAALNGGVSAFEVMWPSYYNFVLEKLPNLRRPLTGTHRFNVLLETDGTDLRAQQDQFSTFLEGMLEARVIEDAAIAFSDKDALDFWAIRDAPGEFPRLIPKKIGFDISFAVRDLEAVGTKISDMIGSRYPGSLALLYGHLGDGNIHLVVDVPNCTHEITKDVEHIVYGLVSEYHGSVSAEHGIGLKKRDILGLTRTADELAVMRGIRGVFDPTNILNRGRILGSASTGSISDS